MQPALSVDRAPTEAQKAAGNYRKGHLRVHGLDITVETPMGAMRRGTGSDGKPWAVKLPAHYGYIRGTEGADSDHVDVYVGPAVKSPKVFVVDQVDAKTGKFDEHKAMLGLTSENQARNYYARGFSDGKGKDRLGAIHEMSIAEFKDWLKRDTTKPLADDDEADKLSHSDVEYVAQSTESEESCAGCTMFIKPEDGAPGCTLVRSPIAARGWCRRFDAAPEGYAAGGRVGYADGGALPDAPWAQSDEALPDAPWAAPAADGTAQLKDAFASGAKPNTDEVRVAGNLRSDPVLEMQKNASTQFASGVPVLGAFTDQAGAAVSAAAHPVTGAGAEGTTYAERYAENVANEKADREAFEKAHPIVSGGLNMAGGMASMAPVAATALGARALGVTGPTLFQRIGAGAVSNAGIGAVDAAARGHSPTTGALTGLIAGAAAPAVAAGIGRAISPTAVRPERQVMVDALRREGVEPTAGQASGARALRWAEGQLGDLPGAGGAANRVMDQQGRAFTRAALRRAGIDAELATADVMEAGARRIGQQFETLSARNTLAMDRQFGNDIGTVMREYDVVLPSQQRETINRYVQDLMSSPNGRLPGNVYQEARSRLSKQSDALRQSDPALSGALRGLRDALDNAMNRSISPGDRAAWGTARREWGHLRTLERAVAGAGENSALGYISPSQLRTAVASKNRGSYARGHGDMTELARAGEAILRPLPNSGTASRSHMQNMITALTTGAGAVSGGIPGAIAGAMGPGMAGRVLLSGLVQGYAGNRLSQSQRSQMVRGLFAEGLANHTRQKLDQHVDQRGRLASQ